jgi:hypothetical protein
MTIGLTLFSCGFLIGLRFIFLFIIGEGAGHIQSLTLASILLGMGFQTMLVAFLADLLAANRKLLESIRLKVILEMESIKEKLGTRTTTDA